MNSRSVGIRFRNSNRIRSSPAGLDGMLAPVCSRFPTPTEFLTSVLASGLATQQDVEAALADSSRIGSAGDLADWLVGKVVLTRFQANRLLASKSDGLVLGPYVILEPTSADRTGQVFRARHRTMNRFAAVKVLAPEFTRDPEQRNAFEVAIRAAARLGHPNVLTIYDINRLGERLYIVLEYVEAIAADAFIKQEGPPSLALACELLRQVALGLQHAHDRGIVHGALTPECLLISRAQRKTEIKISNFGFGWLNALPHTEQGMTSTSKDLTCASDLFALGNLFVFLLMGQDLARSGASNLASLRPDLPKELLLLVNSLLAARPADRPASAFEVACALSRYAAAEDAPGQFKLAPPTFAVTGFRGSVLSGLVPPPEGRCTDCLARADDTAPWVGLTGSTLDETRGTVIEPFDLPPETLRRPANGFARLSGFAVVGLATTIILTTVLVASILLRQFAR